jgi:hypothetical protein
MGRASAGVGGMRIAVPVVDWEEGSCRGCRKDDARERVEWFHTEGGGETRSWHV